VSSRLRLKLFLLCCLLGSAILSFCVSSVFSYRSVDSWADIEVLSFNGESIFFTMKVYVVGNHTDGKMWIRVEPPSSDSVYVEVRRGIADIIYNEGLNVTIFSYSYAYNHTAFYNSGPKFLGYLLFPQDKHKLSLLFWTSFNHTIDEHWWNCKLPSQNYEGKFRTIHTPTNDEPLRYTVELEIEHSPKFIEAISLMLGITIGFTYVLSIVLSVMVILVFGRKKSYDLVPNIIRVSSTIIFFVPAFEIAIYGLKSPLPLVFSDVLMTLVIPWNMIIIMSVILLSYFKKEQVA